MIVGSASAQTLSVQDIEVQTGGQTVVVVSLTGGTTMTALQFNLKLPEGISYAQSGDSHGAMLGAATDGHTLCVQTLDGGDLLFILYSMDLNCFKDGELLRIPVTAGSRAMTATGKLYTVRTAMTETVSHACGEASFRVTVSEPSTVSNVILQFGMGMVYDLSGRRLSNEILKMNNEKLPKGLYITNGKKVLVK